MALNVRIYLLLPVLLLAFLSCEKKEVSAPVKREIVDGIVFVKNPEKPLNGKIDLEIKKIREVDPYKTEEFGLRWIDFKRHSDGELLFYNPNGSEIHRFSSDGTYLGQLTREGQGPGEFSNFQFLNPFFVDNGIYVTGSQKLARFEENGNLLYERKIGYLPRILVDEFRFFTEKSEWGEEGRIKKIFLVTMSSEAIEDSQETIFFQDKNLGWIQNQRGDGYAHPWGIPNVLYTFDSFKQKMFICINDEYKIYAKNLSGKIEYVAERPYSKISLSGGEKMQILNSTFQEPSKWMIDSFPDTLVAVIDIKSLPKGYLAVFRVVGINMYEVDIFDPEGHYVYSVRPLEEIALDEVKFFSFGFGRIKTREDGYMIYEEYAVQNIPEIFDQK